MMAMLSAGARGNTHSQIKTAMDFPESEEQLFETYREYMQQLNVIKIHCISAVSIYIYGHISSNRFYTFKK